MNFGELSVRKKRNGRRNNPPTEISRVIGTCHLKRGRAIGPFPLARYSVQSSPDLYPLRWVRGTVIFCPCFILSFLVARRSTMSYLLTGFRCLLLLFSTSDTPQAGCQFDPPSRWKLVTRARASKLFKEPKRFGRSTFLS